jgi:hypothetical protein
MSERFVRFLRVAHEKSHDRSGRPFIYVRTLHNNVHSNNHVWFTGYFCIQDGGTKIRKCQMLNIYATKNLTSELIHAPCFLALF